MVKKQAHKPDKIQELVYGIHPVLELLKAKKRKLYTIYTTKPFPKIWGSISKLLSKDTQLQYVERDILTRIAGTTDHQGVVAWASPLVIRSKFFEPNKSSFLLLLDSIQDPRNLGAILRSAYCTGVTGVILCGKNSSPLNAVALKSSAGLAEHIDLFLAPTAAFAIAQLKSAGYPIYLAALSSNSINATEIKYPKELCLVIGNEGSGISKNLLNSGEIIMLPQRSPEISYNASVAAGILLFLISMSK